VFLLHKGFQRGKVDTTLFIKHKNNSILLVQIYVDDIIFGATDELLCKEFASRTHILPWLSNQTNQTGAYFVLCFLRLVTIFLPLVTFHPMCGWQSPLVCSSMMS
jgi:hypothetical protein